MIDKVAPMETNLSVLDVRVKGVVEPVQTDVIMQADVPSEEGSRHTVRLPLKLERRPIASFSMVDLASLPVITPSPTTTASTPLRKIEGGKDLELVIQVLLEEGGRQHTVRTLVDTGAKVPLIVRGGLLTKTTPSPTPLRLVTADGTPMMGGATGCMASLKIPIAVPSRKKTSTTSVQFSDQWVYEAGITGVDLIIGFPFLCAMRLVPVPSRRVLMLEGDVVALQSNRRRSCATSSPSRVTVSPIADLTTHSPPDQAGRTSTPCEHWGEGDFIVPLDYINTDWAKIQPWQPPATPATSPTLSIVGTAHDDVPVGVNGIKSVAGGFREKRRRMLRDQGLIPPLKGQKLALTKNLERKRAAAWKTETYIVLDQVRDAVCAFAGFTPVVDAFAEKENARFPKYWDNKADAFKQDWGKHKLWLNPPYSRLPEVVEKIMRDQASGIFIAPVWPRQSWFHVLSNVAVTWWDLPPDKSVFMTRGGITLPPRGSWRVRAVVFDALKTEKIDPWGWSHYTDTRRRISPVEVRSVMDADQQAPGAEPYVRRLHDEFHDVLFDQVYAKDVDPALRGQHGVAFIKLKEGAIPRKECPFRMLGVREEALKAKIEKSIANGWIVPCPATEWGARAFVVPKPGNPQGDGAIPPGGVEDSTPVAMCGPWYPLYGVKPTDNPDEKYWRLVIDYRYLNSQTVDDSFPLPVIEDLITGQALNNIWSLFDLQDGFHQMHLHPQCRAMTAFVTPWGVYMWLVLPMGVKNGPAMFQRMVQSCITHLPFARVYVDDNIVGSRGNTPHDQLEAHYHHVRMTLEAFRKYRLTLKGVKCFLFMLMIKFCGHILCNGTRRAAPSKLQAVAKWSPKMIKTVTHLKSFLGLAQFYSIYMPHYAEVVTPLTEQLAGRLNKATARKLKASGVEDLRKLKTSMNKITWTDEMEAAFNKVKEELLKNVVLDIANPMRPYVLRVDASDYAIGAALSQVDDRGDERPVAFFSRKLVGKPGKGQRVWSVREKETYAIVITLLKFRSWVASTKVSIVVMTDHESLEHWWKEDLGAISGPVGRRGRWHEFLSGFNLEVVYVQGAANVVADALSRWAYGAIDDPGDLSFHGSMEDMEQVKSWEEEERKMDFAAASDLLVTPIRLLSPADPHTRCARAVGEPRYSLMNITLEAVWNYEGDPLYGEIVNKIQRGEVVKGFWLHYGRLRHDHLSCVPQTLVTDLVKLIHRMQHASAEKTLMLFGRQYECSLGKIDLKKLAEEVCRSCQLCQGLKCNTTPSKTLEFYPIPPHVFHSLAMDFVDLPAVKHEGVEFDYALIIVCRMSGYIMALPCRKAGLTAEKMANLYYQKCVWFTGLPKEIFSDHDKLICSRFFDTLCALSGVEKYHSIAYRPQGNGRAEAAVRQVLKTLRKFAWKRLHAVKKIKQNWVEMLPMALFILNDTPGVVAPYSPHQIVFGRNPIGPCEVPSLWTPAVSVAAEEWFDTMQNLWTAVKERLTSVHNRLTGKFEKKHKVTPFVAGDAVWVRRKNVDVPHKLHPLHRGPCEVVEVVRPNRYRVSTPTGIQEFHGEDLKPYVPEPGTNGVPYHYYCPPEDVPEKDTWIIEKIVGHRKDRSGRLQWKCRWRNYGPEEDTWEFAENFVHGVQTDWIMYNKKHGIDVHMKDLKIQRRPLLAP